MKKKILFITNTFGRSGSEMLLLYMINNLNREKFEPVIFCQQNGELINELSKDVKVYVAYKKSKNLLKRLLRKILQLFSINPLHFQLNKIQNEAKANIWYVNTIVNPGVYALSQKMDIDVVTHFHELPGAYSYISAGEMQGVLENSKLFVGCSKVVCEKILDMGKNNVKLLYGFIDANNIKVNLDRESARRRLNLGDTDFVWVISGHTILTKGIEFIIPLLKALKSDAKIVWIGTEVDRGINFYVKETVRNNFKGQMIFIGEQKERYYDYLNCADAFLLLSREDAFPLVMLEAAFLGKPIVSFNSGGVKEFVDSDMGYVVDSWKIEDLANTMLKVETEFSKYDSEKIRSKVVGFTAHNQIEKLEAILTSIL